MTTDTTHFLNRELSWLAFNERVLAESSNTTLPLYARLRFLGIAASNLDEFYMVRVAGLKRRLQSGVTELAADGLSTAEQLAAIDLRVRQLVSTIDQVWLHQLEPALAHVGVHVVACADLSAAERYGLRETFRQDIFPILTPIAIDPGHPFPHLRSGSLNLALRLQRKTSAERPNRPTALHAVVQVPSVLARLVRFSRGGAIHCVLLGDLIASFADELFPGFQPVEATAFRVTRNWDLDIDEEEAEDLLSAVQEELRRRDRGSAVRLELAASASSELEDLLCDALGLSVSDVHRIQSPLQPADLMALAELDPRPELHPEPIVPVLPRWFRESSSMFDALRTADRVLHHPYESFDPVVALLEEAAEDPKVLAIKQTFYRTSGDSPFVRALSRAAENGKQVAALVEIKARFDEANNIAWATRLEESGVHVVYGLIGLKTHCKVTLIVRREEDGIRRYVHLSTGNYNSITAKLYTDFSLFTANAEVAEDVSALFNMLTGLTDAPRWKQLTVAPFDLEPKLLEKIAHEREKALRGAPARIRAKMNSLVDPVVIQALYDASAAGVGIDLVVRGICCLRPGVPGLSERIRVLSVVDRYLEHSRVFAFGDGDTPEVYLSSADWMPRNLRRRIEVLFPILDDILAKRVVEQAFTIAFQDNQQAAYLQADGTYLRPPDGEIPVRSQMVCVDLARRQHLAVDDDGGDMARPTPDVQRLRIVSG